MAAIAAAAPALLIIAVRADFYPHAPSCPTWCPCSAPDRSSAGRSARPSCAARSANRPASPGCASRPASRTCCSATWACDGPGAGYQPGALPLLAHALRATWERRDGATLTVAGYRATGGIRRAVADTAERIYLGLDDAGRAALRRAMLGLVTVVDDLPVRRRIDPRRGGPRRCCAR